MPLSFVEKELFMCLSEVLVSVFLFATLYIIFMLLIYSLVIASVNTFLDINFLQESNRFCNITERYHICYGISVLL